MKQHILIAQDTPNELMAQQMGIDTANLYFKADIKKRTNKFYFSWATTSSALERSLVELDAYCKLKKITTVDSLSKILSESYLIEYDNLKNAYNSSLPDTSQKDYWCLRMLFAKSSVWLPRSLINDIGNVIKPDAICPLSGHVDALDHAVAIKAALENQYTLEAIKKIVADDLEASFVSCHFSPAVKEAAVFEVEQLFEKFENTDQVFDYYFRED